MGKVLDLTGKRFGNLLAIENTLKKDTNNNYLWLCECDCGNRVEIATRTLIHDNRKNCGCCGRKMKNHFYSTTDTYTVWRDMCSRVRKKVEHYEDVELCERWDCQKGGGFENFLEDMGERPEGLSLNRIRGAKLYSKETCEWASLSLQSYDQKKIKTNTSGRTGVSWNKIHNKWTARITKNYKVYVLGMFDSFEEACEARKEGELKYFGFTKE